MKYIVITLITIGIIFLLTLSTTYPMEARILNYRLEQDKHPWIPWEPRPVVGVQKALVLMVEFSDVKFRKSLSDVEEMLDAVRSWFYASSYGRMILDYTVYPRPITLPKPYSYYGAPEPGAQRGDNPEKIVEYYLTITDYVLEKTQIDFGEYSHVIVIHAGGDESTTGNPNHIWSHCLCFGPAIRNLSEDSLREFAGLLYLPSRDGSWRAIYGIETVSEEEDMNIMIHEFTHSMGVADQYIYGRDGYSKGSEVGFWSNMDAGAFIGVDIDGWSKYILGWIEAVEYSIPVDEEVELYTLDSKHEPKAIKVDINDEEYYFIHARRRDAIDSRLPGEGVIVFKINRMLPRTVEDNFMVRLFDANPRTPDCTQYEDDFATWSVCVKLDAAFNEGRAYEWGRFHLNFKNPRFWSEEDGFGVEVLSYDEELGVFKIRLFSSPVEGGGTVETTTTSMDRAETAAREPSEGVRISSWTIIITLIMVLMAASFIISMRRRSRPHTSYMVAVCPICGARVYEDSLYCWRCGAKLKS